MHRVLRAFAVQPHRTRNFKLSSDPFFVEKGKRCGGSSTSTLPITQSYSRSMRSPRFRPWTAPNQCCRWAWVKWKESLMTTFAMAPPLSLPPSTSPPGRSSPNANHAIAIRSFLASSNASTRLCPMILRSTSSSTTIPLTFWLAERPRFQIHFTPTYSSWLNQIERWFGFITQQAIRRGSFRSVKDLVSRIDHFVQHYNRNCRPFAWAATADSTLQKLARLCSRMSETEH